MGKNLDELQKLPLFDHLQRDELEQLLQSGGWHIEKHPGNSMVRQQYDICESFLVLIKGTLSADMLDVDGQILKVEEFRAPETIAIGILFSVFNRLPVQLTAVDDIELLVISKALLLRWAKSDQKILEYLLAESGNKIVFLSQKLRFMSFNTIEEKLAHFIMNLSKQQKNLKVTIPYSIGVLSELFGVSRPSLSRSIGNMIQRGFISKKGKTIHILQEKMLKNIIDE